MRYQLDWTDDQVKEVEEALQGLNRVASLCSSYDIVDEPCNFAALIEASDQLSALLNALRFAREQKLP